MLNIVVLDGICLNSGDLSWNEFSKFGDVTIYDRTAQCDIVDRASKAEILITNKCKLDKSIFEKLPKLKYIGILATGYNTISIEDANKFGITVTNIPAYGTESVVQTIFGLLTELASKIGEHNQSVKLGDWEKCKDFCYYRPNLFELSQKTIGIIGYGQIGQRVAEIALAYKMKVIAYNKGRLIENKDIKTAKTLHELYKESDIISLNCPLNKDNIQMINDEAISLMKDGVVIINTARGGLIDEVALANALKSGKVKGAAVDVLSTEPPTKENPLLDAPNIVITPHIAWATYEARNRLMHLAVENLKNYLEGNETNKIILK